MLKCELQKVTKILASDFTVDSLERIDSVGVRLQAVLKLLAENLVLCCQKNDH